MQDRDAVASYQALNWMEIGEVPPAVKAWQADRMRKALVFGGIVGGILIGGLAGAASNAIVSGPGSFAWNIPLFIGVAIPVGVGSFFFNRWFLPRMARATQLQVRRVAISNDKLYLDQVSGKPVEWTLKRVRVSKDEIAGGWYVVSLPAGRTSFSFWAPPMIATAIRTATTS